MKLADYIPANRELLLEEWEQTARALKPTHIALDSEELRDWAHEMLLGIAEAMQDSGPVQEHGREIPEPGSSGRLSQSAHAHALDRLAQGFNLTEITQEFCAFRATVVRLWTREMGAVDREAVDELVRFNDAVDQALTDSLDRFSTRLERARDLFIGALGHDLRSPLAAIASSAEFLLMAADRLEPQQMKAVVRLRNSATRMRRMIGNLLDFTRTRLGAALPLLTSTMDVGATCEEIVAELGAYNPERDLRLTLAGDLRGTWDQARLEDALSNLISNALKHGRADGPVTVDVLGEADEVVVRIHNEGEPIPREMQRAIFDPLVCGESRAAEQRRSDDGLGLGLYITNEIIQAHGGRIEMSSNRRAGTTFEVRLPRAAAPRQGDRVSSG
jgi:signal transduction histidine kinase